MIEKELLHLTPVAIGIIVFFRFAAALIVVVLISVVGVALEKQTLETKRAVSRQYYQKDLLLEIHAKLRLKIQQRTAPAQLAELHSRSPVVSHVTLPQTESSVPVPETPSKAGIRRVSQLPLMRWAHPANVEASRD